MIDWGTFEIMIFTSGFFGVINQAAQIILMSIAMFLYDFSYGLNDAAAAIIGKQIGKLNIIQAKRIYCVVLVTGLILISLITLMVFIFKDYVL